MEQQIRKFLLSGYSINEIKYQLHLTDEEFREEFRKIILNLENDPNLLKSLRDREDFIVGKIEVTKRGIGYVRFGNKKAVIDTNDLHSALDGDFVLVSSKSVGRSVQHQVEDIIQRKDGIVVVNYVDGKFIPLSVPFDYDIELSDEDKTRIRPNDRLLIKVNDTRAGKVTASLKEVIGYKDDIALREKTISAQYGFPHVYSSAYQKEIDNLPNGVIASDYKTHVDMRGEDAFTIDGVHTQDMDDGIILKELPGGGYDLIVPISHVSRYIKVHGAIFEDAVERGTSLYLGNHSNPMLHRKLSNKLGSLNPDQDTLARMFHIRLDEHYNVTDFKIYDAVIRSRIKMTYYDVDQILVNDIVPNEYKDYVKRLRILSDISDTLERRKRNRGAIIFNENEVTTVFNTRMDPIGFKPIRNSPSRKIIENIALLCNELSDRYCDDKLIRNINRVEEIPDIDKINALIACLNACGYNFDEIHNVKNQRELIGIIKELRKSDKFPIWSDILLRGMQKAYFSTIEIGHYALALDYYAQYTSPIRRLGDLINHIIMDYVFAGKEIPFTIEELEQLSEIASERERAANAASEEMLRINMAQYMLNYIGDRLRGTIVNESKSGLIIKTDGNVIGRVSPRNIMYGKYKYNSEGYFFFDPSSSREYHIGDEVIITARDADDVKGTIDFSLEGHYERQSQKRKTHVNKYKNKRH